MHLDVLVPSVSTREFYRFLAIKSSFFRTNKLEVVCLLTAQQSKKGSGYATKNLNDWQPRPFGPRLLRSRKKTETAVIN